MTFLSLFDNQFGQINVNLDHLIAVWPASPSSTFIQLASETGKRMLGESYTSVKSKVDSAGGEFIETTVAGQQTYINADTLSLLRAQGTQQATLIMCDNREYTASESLADVKAKVDAL